MADEANPIASTSSDRTGGVRTRGGRLPPIRSRDFGQPTPARRIFTPNIPQRRVKVKEEKIQQGEHSSNLDKNFKGDKRGRGRGRGRREYIQTGGSIFGQGLGEDASLKTESRSIDCLKASSVVKPVFSAKKSKNKQEIIEEERKYINEDDFDESGSEGDENGDHPITLPLKVPIKTEIKLESDIKPKIKIEKDLIKSENETEHLIKKEDNQNSDNTTIKDEKKPFIENDDIADLISSGKFLLLQFPENLFTENDQTDDSNVSTQDSSKTQTEVQDINGNKARNMKEGIVGKLQVFKSGNLRVVCGDTILNVEPKNFFNFTEELIMMKGTEESNAEVTKLGNIDKHLTIFPAIETLTIK